MAPKRYKKAKLAPGSNKGLNLYGKTLKKINFFLPLNDQFVYRAVCVDEKIHLSGWVDRDQMQQARGDHQLAHPTHITDYKKKEK